MRKFLSSIITLLSITLPVSAQHHSDTPKLVVGIVIDQLRGGYLNQFYEMFGEGGFKRLMKEGAYFHNMKYDFPNVDKASAIATLYTGANPCYNGITGVTRFDRIKKKAFSAVYDPAFMGNFSDETVSPKTILSTTITDELKIATDGFGSIYAFAPDVDQAVISAGHAGDGAFWIDNRTHSWATSTYYKNVPEFFVAENRKNPFADRIAKAVWTPLNAPAFYKYYPYQKKDLGFNYPFKKYDDNLLTFKTSGLINEEINREVFHFFENENIGKKAYPDFISITYNAGPFQDRGANSFVVETQDLYLRLDKQLEALFSLLDTKIGLKNCLIFVASTGYFEEDRKIPETLNIPTGKFHPSRATALLNMYLMTVYGSGDWVLGYHNREIYLNKKLIDDKMVDFGLIQGKAAEFLVQMSGVQNVVTAYSLLHRRASDPLMYVRNGYHHTLSGDLILELQPGWEVYNDNEKIEKTTESKTAILTPLFFFGHKVKPVQVVQSVNATAVAPSVAYFMRIRAPNCCTEAVLGELQ